MEVMSAEFDYFGPQAVQTAIEEDFITAIHPSNTIAHGSPISFEWTGAPYQAVSLKDTKLLIRCKVTAADGANITADAAVAPVNLILHAMFESVDLEIGKTLVSDANKLYAYRSMFETLLSFDQSTLENRGKLEGWHADEAGTHERILTGTGDAKNAEFMSRRELVLSSRVMTLIGRPHLDMFHQLRCLPPQTPFKLTFHPADSKFCLMGANTIGMLLKITEAKLLVRVKSLSPSILLAQEQMSARVNYSFPYTRVKMTAINLPAALTSHSIPNLFTGVLPSRVVFGIVLDTAYNGAYAANPFAFDLNRINQVELKVNGKAVPRETFRIVGEDTAEGYLSTLQGADVDLGDHSLVINSTNWRLGYGLFVFRLTPEPPSGSVWSVPLQGKVDLTLKFEVAHANALDLIILAEYPSVLEIDHNRNVVI